MEKYFTITTNREVADQIKKEATSFQNVHRSYVLGKITHEIGFSTVQIKAKNETILPEDLFWLGRFSALNF